MKERLGKINVSVNIPIALDKMSHVDAEEMYKAYKTMCMLYNKYGESAVSISGEYMSVCESRINKEMEK